jgi:hypothetical protein
MQTIDFENMSYVHFINITYDNHNADFQIGQYTVP